MRADFDEWFRDICKRLENDDKDLTQVRISHQCMDMSGQSDSLYREAFTDERANALRQALAHNTHLDDLHLNINAIRTEGAHHLAEIIRCSPLKTLWIYADASRELHPLVMSALFTAICNSSTITTLRFCFVSIGNAEGFKRVLRESSSLEHLSLFEPSLNEFDIEALKEGLKLNKKLKSLVISDSNLDSSLFKSLAEGLRHNRTLQRLDLCENNISAEALSQSGPDIEACMEEFFDSCRSVETILLSNFAIGDQGATNIANSLLRHPRNAKETRLRDIHLDENKIGPEGIRALCRVFRENKQGPERVILAGNSIGDEGCKLLGEALAHNTWLRELDLGRNGITDEGLQALTSMLHTNRALKALIVNGNRIGSSGVACLANALKTNWSLRVLDLSNNWIGPVGAGALGSVLQYNTSLSRLELDRNRIGNSGVQMLGSTLPNMKGLRSLGLTSVGMDASGLKKLVEGISENTVIQQVGIMEFSDLPQELLSRMEFVLTLNNSGCHSLLRSTGVAMEFWSRSLSRQPTKSETMYALLRQLPHLVKTN